MAGGYHVVEEVLLWSLGWLSERCKLSGAEWTNNLATLLLFSCMTLECMAE